MVTLCLLIINEVLFLYLSKAFKIFQINNDDLFLLQKVMTQAGRFLLILLLISVSLSSSLRKSIL
jgi:hypothetical protein